MELTNTQIISGLGVVVSVIGVLWALHMQSSKREQERLQKCEKLHEDSTQKVIQLTADYHELKGRMDGVEKLSTSVLEKLSK